MPAGDAPWGQILTELTAIRRDIADLRVDLATHGETARNMLATSRDHEERLRELEGREVVTPSDLLARDERAVTQRRWVIGLLSTLTLFVIGEAIAVAVAIWN